MTASSSFSSDALLLFLFLLLLLFLTAAQTEVRGSPLKSACVVKQDGVTVTVLVLVDVKLRWQKILDD